MKEVIFVRHAKSDWDHPGLKDIERPLAPRGMKDAPVMASKLKSLVNDVDHIISSPATRTIQTAVYFSEIYQIDPNNIEIVNELYEAFLDDILHVLHRLSDEYNRVIFFGHNPGYTYLANLFSSEHIDNVPTCAFFKLKCNVSSWKDIQPENTKLDLFLKP